MCTHTYACMHDMIKCVAFDVKLSICHADGYNICYLILCILPSRSFSIQVFKPGCTCGWGVSKNRQMGVGINCIIRLDVRRWILHNQLSLGVPLELFVVNNFFARICMQIGEILKSFSYQLILSYLQLLPPESN